VQMALVENQDVIQTFATNRTDRALDVCILPSERGAVTTSMIPIASDPFAEFQRRTTRRDSRSR
jgi:hypothetical protein